MLIAQKNAFFLRTCVPTQTESLSPRGHVRIFELQQMSESSVQIRTKYLLIIRASNLQNQLA